MRRIYGLAPPKKYSIAPPRKIDVRQRSSFQELKDIDHQEPVEQAAATSSNASIQNKSQTEQEPTRTQHPLPVLESSAPPVIVQPAQEESESPLELTTVDIHEEKKDPEAEETHFDSFCKRYLTRDPLGEIPRGALYSLYGRDSAQNGVVPLGIQAFTQAIEATIGGVPLTTRRQGMSVKIWKGIRLSQAE